MERGSETAAMTVSIGFNHCKCRMERHGFEGKQPTGGSPPTVILCFRWTKMNPGAVNGTHNIALDLSRRKYANDGVRNRCTDASSHLAKPMSDRRNFLPPPRRCRLPNDHKS